MKTMLNVKTDSKLKREAQRVAKEAGIPISLVVNNALRKFIVKRSITIEAPLTPNEKIAKELKKSIADINSGKARLYGPFKSGKELVESLRK